MSTCSAGTSAVRTAPCAGPRRAARSSSRSKPGAQHVHDAALAERHEQRLRRRRASRSPRAPSGQAPSATSPARSPAAGRRSANHAPRIRDRSRHAHAVGLDAEQQRMEVEVDRSVKVPANQLQRLQFELESADQVDVQRVEVAEQRPESEPRSMAARRPAGFRSEVRRSSTRCARDCWLRRPRSGIASGATRRSPLTKRRACGQRSDPTRASGTTCHDAGSAASNALSAYVMPPHSSTGSRRGSRPWMTSQTKEPMTPRRFIQRVRRRSEPSLEQTLPLALDLA